jgi:hypothetical protein
MRIKAFTAIIIIVIFIQCKTVETALSIGDKVTMEAETFTLADATVVADADASGGEAVEFNYITSKLSGQIELPTGKYMLTVFENAPDKSTDAIYVRVNESPPLRMSADTHGVYYMCDRTITFYVTDDTAPVNIVITSSEIQMRVDRLEFEKLE